MFSLQTYKSEKNIKPLLIMRNSTFRKFLLFLLLLPTFLCTTAWAQLSELEQGKVYRFVNVGQSSYALAATTTKGATGSTVTTGSRQADYPQLWYVTEVKDNSGTKTYRLRNMGNGHYLQGNGKSTQWKMVKGETTESTYLYLITCGKHNTLSDQKTTGGHRHMHLDGSKNVVGWLTSSESTQWDITAVDIDASVIAQNWASLENINFSDTQITNYQTALDAIFTDKACTTLRRSYASKSEAALTADASYTALPPILQNMVMKTWRSANGIPVSEAWAEANFDNSKPEWGGDYAKRFRIQNYEIYTERECAHSALKINIHTNLNNPTGIFGNYRQPLFIMVDQDVPANASLYLGSYSGHGQGAGYNDGVQLHKGLNIIPFWGDKTWTCIYYTAKTMKAWDGTTTLTDFDLTDFPDLKIHIEGGNVNGYYNAVGDDLWAHNAATTGCDEKHNVASLRTNLTKDNGSTTETNNNLIQKNNVYPKGDNEADWDYLAARNVLEDLTIVGRYMVYQFCFNSPDSDHPEYCTDYWFTKHDDTRRVRIPDVLERWDRIMMSQRLTMGLLSKQEVEEANARFHAWDADKQDIYTFPGEGDDITKDYSKHYRMHGLAITMNTGYMSGGWTSSNYNYGTLPSIIGADMTNESNAGGVVWGPAHEIGHQHQKPINMNGLTEVTNNMFANIAVWYDGRSTSRMNGGEGDLSSVLNAYERENYDFFSNNIWAQTHLYYKLWLYYHLTGKNKNFLPRLFELLRRDPMEISYNQEGKKSLLHFYKKACEAAGEDLTEFFRAYGFFTVMNKRFVGDYANSEYTQTQEDIDEAIQYVKAKKYPKNLQVLFINDATPDKTYLRHDGTTARAQADNRTYSDLGAYTDYQNPADGAVDGTYQMTVENGKAILSGATGGAGFLLYDEAGNLLAFSNDKTFPLTDATMLAISSGKASVKVMDVAGVTQEVSYDSESAAASLLKSALNQALPVLNHVDEGGDTKKNFTKVGFFKGHTVENLRNVYTKARTIYDNRQTVSYITAAQSLKKAIEEVLAREDARVAFIPGSTCTLRCFAYPTHYLTDVTKTVNNEVKNIASTKVVTAESNLTDAEHWIIESNGEKGHYKLKNKSTGRYISTIAQSIKATTGATAKDFVLTEIQTALWGFNGGDMQWIHCAASSDNDIVGWNADEDASKWYIVMTEKDEALVAENDLQNLISRTRTLVDEVAQVGMKGDMDMANMRIYSNTPEQYHGTEMLVDGDAETYFHTNWSGNDAVTEDHYLLFDCDAMPLEEFAVRYTTLPNSAHNVDAPKTIVVEGANKAVNGIPESYTTIATLSSSDATNPLPTANAMSYTSATLGTAGTSYRYIRLRVTDATGGTWGTHKYFGLAELTLVRQAYKMFGIESKYTNNVTEANITDALTAITAAETAIAAADKTTSTLQNAYTVLEEKYNVLATAKAKANSETSDIALYRTALQTLYNNTQTLLNECGTVTVSNFALQSTNANAAGYLYCNAPYTGDKNPNDYSVQGTDGYRLLDNDLTTYLHTDYSGNNSTDGLDHYIRVYCGERGIEQFTFSYTTRNGGDGQPTSMVVEGSNEEAGTYTELASLTGLPTSTSTVYSSETLGTKGTSYKYIRFRVTGNKLDKKQGGHYWFCMAEFDMAEEPQISVSINENCGIVDNNDILNTYYALQAAQSVLDMATTIEEFEAGTAALQAQYNALSYAKNTNPADKAALNTVISSTQTTYASCFSDAECTAIKNEYASSLNVTASFLAEVKAAIDAAQLVAQNFKATQAEVNEQTNLLTAKANQLNHAIAAANFPVKLTFNTAQPELYSITMKVADGSRLQYRGDSSHGDGGPYDYDKIKRASQLELRNAYQAFYFVPGSEAGRVRLYNYADNKFFGATEYAAGPGKVKAYGESAADLKVKEWKIVANANNPDWYNLQPVPTDGSTTVYYMGQSNDDGTPNLGFRDDADSERALYKFQQDNGMNLSAAYIQLYNYFHTALKHNRQLDLNYASDALGFYPTDKATAFNTAYAAAERALANESSADEVYTTAYNNLVAAYTALEPNLPVAGKYYVVRSAATNNNASYCQNALIYADKDIHRMKWGTDKTKSDATAIWTFERQDDGTFLMKNLHTATGPGNLTGSGEATPLQEQSLPVTIASFDYTLGNLTLSIGGKNAHAQESGNNIISWGALAGNASLWTLEELTESELGAVGYTLSMLGWGNASFYSAYPVSIPNGLKAYYLQGDEALDLDAKSEGTAKLTEITGVIPAGTGVILRGAKGSYTLPFAADAWTNEAPADNLLKGSPYKCFKPGVAGTSYYVFGVKNGHVGLYKAYLEYDANGSQGENNAYNDTNKGGCFLVEANRIYMERTGTQNLAAGFRLLDPEQTGISLTELDAETETVYDLQGRRVLRVKTPGFYLINGQKRFVRP